MVRETTMESFGLGAKTRKRSEPHSLQAWHTVLYGAHKKKPADHEKPIKTLAAAALIMVRPTWPLRCPGPAAAERPRATGCCWVLRCQLSATNSANPHPPPSPRGTDPRRGVQLQRQQRQVQGQVPAAQAGGAGHTGGWVNWGQAGDELRWQRWAAAAKCRLAGHRGDSCTFSRHHYRSPRDPPSSPHPRCSPSQAPTSAWASRSAAWWGACNRWSGATTTPASSTSW